MWCNREERGKAHKMSAGHSIELKLSAMVSEEGEQLNKQDSQCR